MLQVQQTDEHECFLRMADSLLTIQFHEFLASSVDVVEILNHVHQCLQVADLLNEQHVPTTGVAGGLD